jgi:hypothetical protein
MIATFASFHSFALPSWPKSLGKLSEAEDALPCIRLDFLLPNPPKQAKIALFYGLLTAPLAKLADLAVIVQNQRRGLV